MDINSIAKIISRKLMRTRRIVRQRYFESFIFIHINKTGGSSIECALGIPLEHRTAKEKIAEIGLYYWKKKYTFTVVRNPWDKVVSHYYYRWERDETGLKTDGIEFNEWVKLTYGKQDPQYFNYPKMFQPQMRWIADDRDQILVDSVFRFENLEDDFNMVSQRLGISASLPHLKASDRNHYREYYSDETRFIIEAWFRSDLDQFGYTY